MKLTLALVAALVFGSFEARSSDPASPQAEVRAFIFRAGQNAGEYSTIGAAIKAAVPGDVIRIAPGTFHEVVTISGDRMQGGGVVLEGDPLGSVLDGADPGLQKAPNTRWQQQEDGSFLTEVDWAGDPARAHVSWASLDTGSILAAYHKEDLWRSEKRGAGTLRTGRTVRFRPGHLGNPGNLPLSLGISEAVVHFREARGWTLRNIELRHGGNAGVKIEDGCGEIMIESVIVRDSWSGITTEPESKNIAGIKILNCRILNRWGHEWPWVEAYADAGSASDRFTGPMRGTGIDFFGSDAVIAGNLIEGGWDGMGIRGKNISVKENIICGMQDDAIELECGTSSDIRVFDNLIYDVFVGISTVANQPGPVYVYRNKISANRVHISDPENGRAKRFGFALKMGTDWGPGASNVFFYHNTIFAKRLVLWDKEQAKWENFQFLNNIFINDGQRDGEGLEEDVMIWNAGLADRGCRWDGNLYWRPGGSKLLFRRWNGVDAIRDLTEARNACPAWEVNGLEGDPWFVDGTFRRDIGVSNQFEITAESPARNNAVPLPAGWPDSREIHDALPDIGADEWGGK